LTIASSLLQKNKDQAIQQQNDGKTKRRILPNCLKI